MAIVRIVAKYIDDEKQLLVILGPLDDRGFLLRNAEMFGYARDWTDESSSYIRYPFILIGSYDERADVDWGGGYKTITTLDFLGRRIAVGEKIVRIEDGVSSIYTVVAINQADTQQATGEYI